ncbi:MAG: hypothetical protein LHV69_08420 [Elusimicrobia bacterium]|nr:hypothetical protein [Candidatus Obscuribacterium magneticum]
MPRYFISTLVYFWIPVLALGFFLRHRLDPLTKKAFWITLLIMLPVTTLMEYVYLWTDIWSFSEEMDPLLGIWIFGAPIEEFSFWYGGPPFMLLTYLTLDWWMKRPKKGGGNARKPA